MNIEAPTAEPRRYHHGDLRAALLAAAEDVLVEDGLEAFSLRKVAKRVGVSHAAPAHHFGDAAGLLSDLAEAGFTRFRKAMEARQARVDPSDARAMISASGLGYLDFASENRALFRLMFASDRAAPPDDRDYPEAYAAFDHLAADIERLRGVSPFADEAAMLDALAVWSTAHGLADLYVSGRMKPLRALDETAREQAFTDILLRAIGA